MTISIYRNKFLYYSWDKRKEFKFQVVNYPNLLGKIPSGPSFDVYISQLIRFCDTNMTYSHFLNDIKYLTQKLQNQGFNKFKVKDKFIQFRNNYFFKWAKYKIDISIACKELFSRNYEW